MFMYVCFVPTRYVGWGLISVGHPRMFVNGFPFRCSLSTDFCCGVLKRRRPRVKARAVRSCLTTPMLHWNVYCTENKVFPENIGP